MKRVTHILGWSHSLGKDRQADDPIRLDLPWPGT